MFVVERYKKVRQMLDFKGKNKKAPFSQGRKKTADNGNRTRDHFEKVSKIRRFEHIVKKCNQKRHYQVLMDMGNHWEIKVEII